MIPTAWEEGFQGKRCLVTGGLGFIGSNLAHRLIALGAEVTLVDSLIPEYGGNRFNIDGIQSRLTVHLWDVRDAQRMNKVVRVQDYLFNLAGQTSHLDSMRDPHTDLDINAAAQLSILEACRKHNPGIVIVYASTRQIYGVPDRLPVDEGHLLHPVDVNGINKMAGEWYHIVYHNAYGIRTCALRLTNTYGPRMRVKDARQTFLGWWIRQAIEGSPIQVYGDGRQLRDLTYVDDVVEVLLRAAVSENCYGKALNVGGDGPINLKDLAQLLVEVAGGGSWKLTAFPKDQKTIDIGDYYADDRCLRKAIDWAPAVKIREGLTRTISYYRENKDQYWKRTRRRRAKAEVAV